MRTIIAKWIARLAVLAAVAALTAAQPVRAASPERHFECSGGMPNKICGQSKADETYDLWGSDDLAGWSHVKGYPKPGTGGMMEHPFTPGARGFFKITSEASAPESGPPRRTHQQRECLPAANPLPVARRQEVAPNRKGQATIEPRAQDTRTRGK